jgi:hypothetical protein
MEWLSDRELDELDDVMRGHAGPATGPALLAGITGLVTICNAYPPLSHELRTLLAEAKRLHQHVAQASADVRRLEGELAVARAKITGLESQLRAA